MLEEMKTEVIKKQTVIFTLRLPVELHAQLKESAEQNKRSIAKELEYAAEFYLRGI